MNQAANSTESVPKDLVTDHTTGSIIKDLASDSVPKDILASDATNITKDLASTGPVTSKALVAESDAVGMLC